VEPDRVRGKDGPHRRALRINLIEHLWLLGDRPECEHNLNGPCRVCGPAASIEETLRWRAEMRDLGVQGLADDEKPEPFYVQDDDAPDEPF